MRSQHRDMLVKIDRARNVVNRARVNGTVGRKSIDWCDELLDLASEVTMDYVNNDTPIPGDNESKLSKMCDGAMSRMADQYTKESPPIACTVSGDGANDPLDPTKTHGKAHVPRSKDTPVMLGREEKLADYVAETFGGKARGRDWHDGRLGAEVKANLGWPGDAMKMRVGEEKDMTTTNTGVLVPPVTAAQLIDEMRANLVVVALGARTIPMVGHTVRIPRLTADPTPMWLAEGSAIPESNASFDSVTLEAKRLASMQRVTQELNEDSDPVEIGAVLRQSLSAAFATEIDRVALRGSGTGQEPTGVRNATGVTLTDLGGTADASWTTLTGLNRDVAINNAENTGFVMSPRTRTAIETATDSQGQFVQPPSLIDAIPRAATTQIPTNLGDGNDSEIYAGQWSELILATRVSFELRVLQERFADTGEVGFASRIRGDIAVRHGESFAVAHGVNN